MIKFEYNKAHPNIMTFNNLLNIFEFTGYIPPGIHKYKIYRQKYTEESLPENLLEGKIAVKPREMNAYVHSVQNKQENPSHNGFIKERSVFMDWRPDDAFVIKKAFDIDVRKFRIKELPMKRTEVCLYCRALS